ncbi:MAG: Histidyl-tRNA synthetase [Firmicutes bacterium]|nr:Histidyl-tRNA synthetase [Bacillota bacterium]MDI6706217.1 histidine--tRNA ligase [Bacillota bacterium]
MLTKAPRGTRDVLPEEVYKWHFVEDMFRQICHRFGYGEMRTPAFEHTELFQRGVGETTDIVQKEMYTFEDRGGRSITLKPEGTAPVVRAFVEHKLYAEAQPSKYYYITPCFRYERPQSGRLRAFHQFGVEVFGSYGASTDAEVIAIAVHFFNRLGLKGLEVRVNSVGCPKCRSEYNRKLKEFLSDKLPDLCKTCNTRYETNPLRIIDCKEEKCRNVINDVPFMLDNLCGECKTHFEELKAYLEIMGIEYTVDPRIVRGLDYYTKTAFEIVSRDIGSQGTVCGGGRYEGLVEECGGPAMPGIGFGLGIERLILTLENQGIGVEKPVGTDIYVANVGERAGKTAFGLVYDLRKAGLGAECDHMNRSLKAQMKYSDKLGARFTMVLGEEEIQEGTARLKNMQSGVETPVKLEVEAIKAIIMQIKGSK